MSLLHNYLARAILLSTSLVMLVLLGFFSLFTFIDELGQTGKGQYDTWDAFRYTWMVVPNLCYQLFPPAALIGTLMGLGGLASSSELTAMRASGMSLAKMLNYIVSSALIMMIVVVLIGEWIAPQNLRKAETLRNMQIHNKVSLRTATGLWVKEGDQIININSLGAKGQLKQIRVYGFSPQQSINHIARIREARYYKDQGWLFSDAQEFEISDQAVIQQNHAQKKQWLFLPPDLVQVLVARPEAMSAWGLYQYMKHLETNDIDIQKYEQAFWNKLVSPLTTLVMVLLAVPFILGSTRSLSAGHRILIGVLIGLGFHIINQLFSYLGIVYGINAIVAASLPTLSCLLVAAWLLRKVR